MTPEFLQMVIDRDEVGLESAFFDNQCPHFFEIDWRGDDADIVAFTADALNLESLAAEWRGEDLIIRFDGREVKVPLRMDEGDRHITVCALNDVLSSRYEVRYLVFSHGSDSAGFAALSGADWQRLEQISAGMVAENFIDPRRLPNLITELTDEKLPPDARARFERMLQRNKRR